MKIICFGDSNTFGFDPREPLGGRYDMPWPELLAEKTGWTVINQGENGREIPESPVSFPEDTDLLIVMLGTNDLLQFWTPEAACEKMEHFLTGLSIPVFLVAPPAMALGAWVQDQELIDDSVALANAFQRLAARMGIPFANATNRNVPLAYDGVHLTEEGHKAFAKELLQYLTKGD